MVHELGHALGLGHSTDSTSVMYATLNPGTVRRSLNSADLNVPDSDTTGACGLHAALPHPAPIGGGRLDAVSVAGSGTAPSFRSAPIANASARNLLFALLGSGRFPGGGQTLSRAWPSPAAQDAAFASFLAEGNGSQIFASSSRLLATSSGPIFAVQPLPEPDDTLFDLRLFTDPVQDSQGDGANPDGSGAIAADTIANFFTADPDSKCTD